MALKTAWWSLVLVLLAPSQSPLQFPVPPPGPPRQSTLPEILIGPTELAQRLKTRGAVPLDARDDGAYAEGHLPGAVSAEEGIPDSKMVVVYGDGDREEVARRYWLLRRAGRSGVRVLDGGIAAWRAAGLPVETEPAGPRTASEPRPSPASQTAVDVDWVAESFGQEGVELLDVRDARGWDQWKTPPTFAAGHIPYALPFDPRALLPAEGWPEPATLRRRLAAFGPRPGDPVSLEATFVLYTDGDDDPRLALGYLLLELAGLDARVFPGGWKEWTAGGTRPVVRVVTAAELAGLLRRGDPKLSADRPPRDLILLDLRDPRDFAIGHLPGALSLPFLHFAADFEKTVEAGWPEADRARMPLVLYCYGIDCVRSRKAGAQAARAGFRDLLWFRGGVQEWRDARYPLLDSPPAPATRPSASPGRGDGRP
jgi:thiosulfate/3-mercaptopyruvate sulfurtransferase